MSWSRGVFPGCCRRAVCLSGFQGILGGGRGVSSADPARRRQGSGHSAVFVKVMDFFLPAR